MPFAKLAAIMTFSVAPTDTDGNLIFAPVSPFFASAKMYPFFILILAPNFFNQKR